MVTGWTAVLSAGLQLREAEQKYPDEPPVLNHCPCSLRPNHNEAADVLD